MKFISPRLQEILQENVEVRFKYVSKRFIEHVLQGELNELGLGRYQV